MKDKKTAGTRSGLSASHFIKPWYCIDQQKKSCRGCKHSSNPEQFDGICKLALAKSS